MHWIALLLVACQSGTKGHGPLYFSAICQSVFSQTPQPVTTVIFWKLFSSPTSLQIECQNYIRVLLVNKTEVMTCGTNAFQPLCITREVKIVCVLACAILQKFSDNTVRLPCYFPLLPVFPLFSPSPYRSIYSSIAGGQHEQRAGAGEWRGALPVRSSSQLHGSGDRERRAVCRHRHWLLWPRPRHIPQPGWHATSSDRPVQLKMAQWYSNTHLMFLGSHGKLILSIIYFSFFISVLQLMIIFIANKWWLFFQITG